MNRRRFVTSMGTAVAAVATPQFLRAQNHANSEQPKGLVLSTTKLTPPARGRIPVAILISEYLNVIDFSGPWGVFESVILGNSEQPPFKLFTISDTADIVTSYSGLKLKPDYTFANAPEVKVIVIPAQKGSDAMIEWLRKAAPKTDVTMSVCTGAFKLAKAGLLSGKSATTHHDAIDQLEKQFPDIHVKRDVRFVENEQISTAGGLTSGTDLALRVVERYFGRAVAQNSADYMEYHGTGWIV